MKASLSPHPLIGTYEELVVAVVRLAHPVGLYKTAVAKLTYLIDFEAARRLGEPISDAHYRRQERGPLPLELIACNSLDGYELSIAAGLMGGRIFSPGPRPRFEPLFRREEWQVISDVLRRFPRLDDIDALTKAAYETEPMRRVVAAEQKAFGGRKVLGKSLFLTPPAS